MSKEKLGFDKMRSIFFFGLIIVLAIALLYVIRPFLYPVFWAAVIAILFHPMYEWLDKYLKLPSLSALTTLILVVIIIFLPLTLLSTLLINESVDLYQTVSHWNIGTQLQDAAKKLNNTSLAPLLNNVQSQWGSYAADAAKTISIFLFNNIKNITENSLRFVFMLFIMFYALFYFLKDGTKLLKQIMHLSPLGDEHEIMLYDKFHSTARATLKGTFIVGGVQGILGGILFWSTGIEGALIWGVIMVALATIPAIGPSIIWFPAGVIMLALGNVWEGLAILLVGVFIISTIDNFIRPKLVGKDIQMHPLLVLFSTLGGIFLFGISGFVIGPIIASLFVAVMAIYDHHYRNELQNN
ncbi:MAG: AI-2E family transporter [Candidatus Magasanikbacteria bacterium]|nr:AI-2E family transporter [Candidatus Magasanikbacteria bacterium]